jgi:ubiquinone/menaquinone biosynthesis C-methylase UbiE
MKELSQVRNHAPRIPQVQRPANRPLHNIRQKQTHQHKDQQPPVMRPRTRALRSNRVHALQSINQSHRHVLAIIISMDNTERFTGRAENYDRYRLRYPANEILKHLQAWCGLQPTWSIADIGAGTGMLSEVFLSNGNPVIAIEPNGEMRATCTDLHALWPMLQVRDATAEATGLPEASVAIVAAGRAFHWFDIPRALTEFRRILQPYGWLVLVSLGRAKIETPQSRDFEALLTTHGTDYTNYVRAGYRVHENLDQVFTSDRHHEEIPGKQTLNWESFLGQTLSLSITPQRDNPRFPTFYQHLHEYFQTYAINGILTMPTSCWIDAGHLSTQ